MMLKQCFTFVLMENAPKTLAEAIRVKQGARIKEFRELHKMTQGDLADLVGVTKAAVSDWERGVSSPRPHLQALVARELRAPWAHLFEPVAS